MFIGAGTQWRISKDLTRYLTAEHRELVEHGILLANSLGPRISRMCHEFRSLLDDSKGSKPYTTERPAPS